tara:strand:+ start:7290 stop:8255 length:966 start_codon:yes stop_codon:yes gene_type:complete
MRYVIYQKDPKSALPKTSQVQKVDYSLTRIRINSIAKLVMDINKADKIILHGLNEALTILLLFFMPWNLKKCYWFTWGDEVYKEILKSTFKLKVLLYFKRFVISNSAYNVVGMNSEYENIRKIFNPKGKRISSFKYPSNIFKQISLEKSGNDTLEIMVGNSADPGNYHEEIFELLKQNIDKKSIKFKIICPLSYGDKEYAEKIIRKGRELFGDSFFPVTNFLPLPEYNKMLSELDIAIFNHRRQQALGNIITLVGLGKKVFISQDVSTWDYFQQIDIVVYSSSKIDLEPIPNEIAKSNSEKIRINFSAKKLERDLRQVFFE